MSEYSLLQDSLQDILAILRGRSERLDRFEAALVALGHLVNKPRNDLCGEHEKANTPGCTHCVQLRLVKSQEHIKFLTDGLRQLQALAASKGQSEIVAYVESLLSPPTAD